MTEDPLLVEARKKFRQISSNLDQRLDELQASDVLTQTDMLKLKSDARQSGHAVLQALDKTDYPLEMQRELVNRLIVQFEASANDILSKAESRVFNREYIEKRLREIDQRIMTELGTSARQWADGHRKVFKDARENFMRQLHQNSPGYSKIENLFEHYEEYIRKILQKNLPQIDIPQEERRGERVLRIDIEDVSQYAPKGRKKQQKDQAEKQERSFWKKVKSIFSREGD